MQRIAVSGRRTRVGIDDDRQPGGLGEPADVVGDLAERDQAEVRHAVLRVGEAGAGGVRRLEAGGLDQPGAEGVGDARQDERFLGGEGRTQREAPLAGLGIGPMPVTRRTAASWAAPCHRAVHGVADRGPCAARIVHLRATAGVQSSKTSSDRTGDKDDRTTHRRGHQPLRRDRELEAALQRGRRGPSGDPAHGSGAGATGWSNFAPNIAALAEDFRVLALDAPGWGRSDAATSDTYDHPAAVLEFMDALGIEKAALVGNSMGGMTAITFAARYPDRISHLITMGPGSFFSVPAMFGPGDGPSEGLKILQEGYRNPHARGDEAARRDHDLLAGARHRRAGPAARGQRRRTARPPRELPDELREQGPGADRGYAAPDCRHHHQGAAHPRPRRPGRALRALACAWSR